MHGCNLFFQPTVKLKSEFPSIYFKACGQRAQLCHEDFQTSAELQLLCDHVHL